MADLDSNPFADPEDNPFGDSTPRNAGSKQTAALDDYNPFAQQPTAAASKLPPPQAAVVAPPTAAAVPSFSDKSAGIESADAPPPYQLPAAQQVDTSELQRRQEELERKAAELQERENKLRDRTIHGAKDNNWPPLPACCPVKPCFYQDIDLEISTEFSKIVKLGYYTWIARSLFYLLNFIFSLGYIGTVTGTLVSGTTVGLAILYLVLFVPLSFLCWYRPLYKAFRSDSSISFFVFFIVSGVQVIGDVVAILGPIGTGYLGLLSAIPMMSNEGPSRNMGYAMMVVVAIAVPLLIIDLVLLFKVHRLYRTTDASFQKAQSEFTTGVLKNDGVRKAGAQLASDTAANAMNNAADSNRY